MIGSEETLTFLFLRILGIEPRALLIKPTLLLSYTAIQFFPPFIILNRKAESFSSQDMELLLMLEILVSFVRISSNQEECNS